jgi:hypothetical protein
VPVRIYPIRVIARNALGRKGVTSQCPDATCFEERRRPGPPRTEAGARRVPSLPQRQGRDLRCGFDATDATAFERLGTFDFIWLHPPYWQMVRYNAGEPRCLSNAPTLDWFIEQIKRVFRNCRGALRPGGKLAVLMGDCRVQGRYLGLPFLLMNAAASVGFWLAAPEIIRFSHGATSSRQRYTTAFIPRLHDVGLVLERVKREAGSRTA